MVNAVKNSKVSSSLNQMDCFSSMRSHQALQASALVGRQVLVNQDCLSLKKEEDVLIAIDLPQGLTNLTVTIHAKNGEPIKTWQWKQVDAGFFKFFWDGKGQDNKSLALGKYKIKASGIHNGQTVFLKTMIAANVDSVSLNEKGKDLKLNVAGVGPIALEALRFV